MHTFIGCDRETEVSLEDQTCFPAGSECRGDFQTSEVLQCRTSACDILSVGKVGSSGRKWDNTQIIVL